MEIKLTSNNRIGRVTFSNKRANRFSDLVDVVSAGAPDGAVLVYNANTGTYQVQTLPTSDGGSF
ncbi:MAG TPA: hypothetical protein DEB23_00210 [Chitinophagaceae bacterium]|jgi:hypothetical protein|nr:hypothetical protein [Chitinophagaceae bacterium]